MSIQMERENQVPLCDLGFGPLSCFVTMKPFSCDHLAPKTPVAVRNHHEKEQSEIRVEERAIPKSPGQKVLDASPMSFSSGGSSPSKRFFSPRAKKNGNPARSLTAGREPLEEAKRKPKFSDEDQRLLLDAWQCGRLIEANRLVQKSRSGNSSFHEVLSKEDLELLQRVEASYVSSLDELVQKAGAGWMKDRDEEQDLDMAFRLSNDLLQAVASTVCTGYDIVQVLDGLLDYVQQHEHNDDLEVQLLNNELEQDALLRVFRSGHGRMEDNILHCSWCDALDEPLGALWLSSYTFKGRHPEFRGLRLPRPKTGYVRLSFWRSSFAIAPQASPSEAVRVTYALAQRPSAACIFPSIMHREVGRMLTSFKQFLKDRGRNESRDLSTYSHIHRHLAECGSRKREEVQEVSFQELAALLPEDWADYHDPVHVNDHSEPKHFT